MVTNIISLLKIVTFFENKSDESKILVIFRFVSLFITSVFYIISQPDHDFLRRVMIIGCLLISSIILSYLYPSNENSKNNIKTLIIIETIGNILLLIPSGGIKSSFIWYSLNTILISTLFISKKSGWLNLLTYLLFYGIINNYLTNNNIYNLEIIKNETNLLLSFIMIILAIQLLTISIRKIKKESKRLENLNIQLETSNEMLRESLDIIKSLYQSVNILTSQGNKEGIIKLSYEHIKKITKTNTVFYFDITNNFNKLIYFDNSISLKFIEEYILNDVNKILELDDPIEININNTNYLIVHVGSAYDTYGLLGMETVNNKDSIIYKNNAYQLQFISELISNSFERLNLEEVSDRLIITEEQNRIANEIHDSVLQRLFSLSCGMFSLMRSIDKHSSSNIIDELNNFRTIIDTTMKELRDKIYGLSWNKFGSSSFTLDTKRYIDDIKRLNKVNIPFNINGNIEILSTEQKKALYRIICEGIGNAVKHGKSKNIEVTLNITKDSTNLTIIDDGLGFDFGKTMKGSTKGLGIENLHQLTESLLGEISINSKINNGTVISIILPNLMMKGEAAI